MTILQYINMIHYKYIYFRIFFEIVVNIASIILHTIIFFLLNYYFFKNNNTFLHVNNYTLLIPS